MALLATLEGVKMAKGGNILGACLGACSSVINGAAMAGCALLGGIDAKRIFAKSYNFYIPDLNYQIGFNAITDPDERAIAQDFGVMGPGIAISASKSKYGLDNIIDYKVTVNTWMLPVQHFLNYLYQALINYPDLNLEGAATKAYFAWLANNPKPDDYRLQTMYDAKVNALNEFMAGMGWWSGVVKAKAEASREKQGAIAQAQASEAARAYAEAMAKKAAQEKQVEQEYKTAQEETRANIQEKTGTKEKGTGSSLLPLAVAALAAFSFMG
jgi:hypothetical protein